MQFVQVGFVSALAALVIPIIIHLLFKRRSRRVDLGTLRFLRAVLVQNARRRRLKRWLLMAMRMAAVGLLVLLFARPFLPEVQPGKAGRMVVLLVDRSATMDLKVDGQRLVEMAAAQANQVIDRTEDAEIHVAWFDHSVEPVTESAEGKRPKPVPPDKAAGGTNYGIALMWARDILAGSNHKDRELHVFTDLQQSGMDWFDMQPMPEETEVHITDLGRSVINNLAIVGANTTTLIRPGNPAEVSCTVANEAVFPIEQQNVVFKLQQGNRVVTEHKRMKLEPGSLTSVDFSIDQLRPGLWQGTIELEEASDDLNFDNLRHVAVMVADQTPVLIVDGRPNQSSLLAGSYFLEAAIRLAVPSQEFAGSPYDPTVVSLQASGLPDLREWPIVILSDVSKLNPSVAGRLKSFVADGGNLLIFTGDQVIPDSYTSLYDAGVLPGKLSEAKTSFDLPWRFDSWNGKHPVMQPFDDPQHGDVRRLAFRGVTPVTPADDAQVVASFRNGLPAITERSLGKGRTLLFASSCDRQWSDWPRSRLYVPMVHQMLGYLTGLAEGGPIRQSMIGSVAETEPGIYERDRYWDVVNPSPRESEVDRTTVSDFAERFGLQVAANEESPDVQAKKTAGIEMRKSEVWPMFLLVLIAVLGLESMLANRTLA